MAVSSTAAAAACLSPKQFPSHQTPRINVSTFSNSLITKSPARRFSVIRSNSDAPAESSSTAATETEDPESSIEVPQGPPSLISTLNVERALRGIPITDVDHYGVLGVQRNCRYEEVTVAYKNKVDEIMNQGVDEDELNKKLELLKESYAILSSEQERRLYDWSLSRSENPDRYSWPFEVDDTPTSKGDPPPQEPEDEGPTRLVGYFILGWIILAVILSIALNR
uniref:Chaperone DnaJ-domain superfamily protein n=1 Tax=Hypseocharis bilobata TaxID=253189 RepID=A0A0F7H181_9ROSI